MATHRYLRLYVRGTAGTWVGISEIELRDSIGGLDRTGSGTASDSAHYTTWTADKAVDNNTATAWASYPSTPPQWWAYDFGAGNAYDIVQISITPRTDGYYAEAPRDFDVQFSDNGTDWTTKWSVNGNAWPNANPQVFTFVDPNEKTGAAAVAPLTNVAVPFYVLGGNVAGAVRVTHDLIDAWVRDTPSSSRITKELIEVWTRVYNLALLSTCTVIHVLPCVGRGAAAPGSTLTVVAAAYAHFDGHRVSGPCAVNSPTLVEAAPVLGEQNFAVFANTDIVAVFKLGGFASVDSPTVIAAAPASRKVAALQVTSPTSIEVDSVEISTHIDVDPVVSLTQIKCFPLLRAVTPTCLTAMEPAPEGGGDGGGLRNYVI